MWGFKEDPPQKNAPDFLGIGAQKAGTTWLYENLKQHPDLYFPPMKEVHFWDLFYDKGLDWYKDLFPANGDVRGEITPAYAILPIDKIKEIYVMNPDLRLIYLVRNPRDRAWSAAKMMMNRQGLVFEKTPDEWFIKQFQSQDSRMRGDYESCLTNWKSVFPNEQILVLDYSKITKNPVDLMVKICAHISIPANFFKKRSAQLTEKIFSGSGEEIRPSLKKILAEIYPDEVVYKTLIG